MSALRTAVLAALALGCAETTPAGPAGSGPAPTRLRGAPDDSDPVGLIPAGSEALLELSVAALRASPWSRPAIRAASSEQRTLRAVLRGFDEIEDVDRLVLGSVAGSRGESATLAVLQGRFRRDDVVEAFQRTAPAAAPTTWRGSELWHEGERAISFLTPHTFIAGPPATVRAAIDCAWGVLPDVRADTELGEVRRALEGRAGAPAVRLSLIVTDETRSRIRAELPEETLDPQSLEALRRLGVRVDLGRALDFDLVAMLDTPAAARAQAAALGEALRRLRARPALVALGLASFLERAEVAAQGARLVGRLHVPEERRQELADRLAAVAEAVARR